MFKIKSSLFIILTIILSIIMVPLVNAEDIAETIQNNALVAKNGNMEMYINTQDNCNITIKNTKTDSTWTTTPQDYDNDNTAEGGIRNDMTSQLLVSYIDKKNNKFNVSSKISSIKRNTYKIRKFKDGKGVQIDYDFSRESEQFIIPVRYSLSENSLSVEVLFDQIKEYGAVKITNITVLPYMLAGCQVDEGYLFVPDGSGMIIDFTTTKKWASTYEEMIYGRDYSKTFIKETSTNEKIHIPVYGAKIRDTSITAIIEQGDFNAYIGANPAGKYCKYANVYSKFIYRQSDITVISDKDWNSREVPVARAAPIDINPKVSFYFSAGNTANYNGMAKIYRDYLINARGFKRLNSTNTSPKLNIEFYGLAKKQESFLGFMIDKKIVATNLKDVENTINSLNQDNKININAILYGFDDGGYNNKHDKKVNLDSAVGGMGGFEKLQKKAKSLNTEIALVYEPMVVYKNKFFMFRFNNTANTLDRRYTPFYSFKLSTGEKLNNEAYFLKQQSITKYANEYIKSAVKKNAGIAFESVGNKLYTDYNDNNFSDRNQIATAINNSILSANSKGLYTIAFGGNQYIAKSAKNITDIPTSSSGFDLEIESIPFYQIVMHGLVEMSGKSINGNVKSNDDFLHCLETGTQLKYRMVGKNSDIIRETSLNFLYNCYFDNLEVIKQQQLDFNKVHDKLQNIFIKSYARIGNISKTTYENNKIIYINYGDKDDNLDGFMIPAKSYKNI